MLSFWMLLVQQALLSESKALGLGISKKGELRTNLQTSQSSLSCLLLPHLVYPFISSLGLLPFLLYCPVFSYLFLIDILEVFLSGRIQEKLITEVTSGEEAWGIRVREKLKFLLYVILCCLNFYISACNTYWKKFTTKILKLFSVRNFLSRQFTAYNILVVHILG